MEERIRNRKVTAEQKSLLCEYVRKNQELNSAKFSTSVNAKDCQRKWEEIAFLLNKQKNGSVKSWREWKKCWADMKNRVKGKVASERKEMKRTGGGPRQDVSLDESEEEIASLLPASSVEGIEGSEEVGIEFSLEDDLDSMGQEPGTSASSATTSSQASDMIFEGMETLHHEEVVPERVTYASSSEVKENIDHAYSRQLPATVLRKRMSKSSKLENSLKVSQEFSEAYRVRSDKMDRYYERKIKYMDDKAEHDRQLLKVLKEGITTLQCLLDNKK